MSALPGLPRPLECLLRGLLEENRLSSWTSDWADGDVKVTIRFSPQKKDAPEQGTTGETSAGTKMEDFSSDSEDEGAVGGPRNTLTVNPEEGTAGKPRRYHLLELANSPECPPGKLGAFPEPCLQSTGMMAEEKGAGLRGGMTTSVSSSSEEAALEQDLGQSNVRSYRPINIRDYGDTFSSSSAENSSPEGYDEVDCGPVKTYNPTNASDTADNFDATRLVDITDS